MGPHPVFIHGSGSRGAIWVRQRLAFPRAIAPDLPGRGGRDHPGAVGGFVEWLHRYLGEERRVPAVVVGHSLGGAIAQLHALTYPADLAGVVLAGTGARLRVAPPFLDGFVEHPIETAEEFARWHFAPDADARLVEKLIGNLKATPPAVTRADLLACDAFSVMDRVSEIRLPALVVVGAEDRLTPPRFSQYLHQQIAGSALRIIEGAGHMVMWERPAEFNAALRAFLTALPAAPRPAG